MHTVTTRIDAALSLLLLAVLAIACGRQIQMTHIPKPNGPLEIVKDEQLTVALDANPTTGFQWQLAAPLDERVIKVVKHEYQGPDTSRMGAGGTDVWTFKAVGAGNTTIVLEYRRPWEKDVPAADRKTFPVLVRSP
jgi:inhibitor of cysteine peptidase